jgi:hypothetical protein
VVEDRVDRLLVAVDDLQDALGQARLDHQFGQHQRHRRVALGRLEDEGVAAGDGRAELPHRDHGGEVERRDAGGHAQRLAHRIHVDAGAGALGEFALQQMRRADAELDHFEPALHVALGVGQVLPCSRAQRLGQLVHVAVQQATNFIITRARRCGLVAAQPGCAAGGVLDRGASIRRRGQRARASCTSPVAGLKTSAKRPDVLTEGRFRHMPVLEGGEMVGLISIGDVVKARLAELSMEKDALQGMIMGH